MLIGCSASWAGQGAVSLLPEGDPVAAADLFGVLEESSGASDDPTGQPAERERETQRLEIREDTSSDR